MTHERSNEDPDAGADDATDAAAPRPRGRPRQVPIEEQRERILAAATEVFAREGFDGTTSERIAEVSGVGRPSVYQLFGSKNDVFIAAVDRALMRMLDPRNYTTEHSATLSIRLRYWEAASRILQKHFLLGLGVGNEQAVPAHLEGGDVGMQSVHNIYLQIAIETGILGWLGFFTFVGLMFHYARAASRQLQAHFVRAAAALKLQTRLDRPHRDFFAWSQRELQHLPFVPGPGEPDRRNDEGQDIQLGLFHEVRRTVNRTPWPGEESV